MLQAGDLGERVVAGRVERVTVVPQFDQDTVPTERLFNPFPGLRPFRESEAHLFFGRSRQTDDLLGELRRSRFVKM